MIAALLLTACCLLPGGSVVETTEHTSACLSQGTCASVFYETDRLCWQAVEACAAEAVLACAPCPVDPHGVSWNPNAVVPCAWPCACERPVLMRRGYCRQAGVEREPVVWMDAADCAARGGTWECNQDNGTCWCDEHAAPESPEQICAVGGGRWECGAADPDLEWSCWCGEGP